MKLGEVVVLYLCVLQLHQVSLNSDEKNNSFILKVKRTSKNQTSNIPNLRGSNLEHIFINKKWAQFSQNH